MPAAQLYFPTPWELLCFLFCSLNGDAISLSQSALTLVNMHQANTSLLEADTVYHIVVAVDSLLLVGSHSAVLSKARCVGGGQ